MKIDHDGKHMVVVVIMDGKPIGYMSAPEAAEYIGVEKSTIRVWIKRGKISTLKIGKEHWINGSDAYQIKKERESWIL